MEQILFNDFYYKLLQPSPTFDNRGRYDKCRRYWHAIDEAEQAGICRLIRQKRADGEYVSPNPCYAMNDAMQDYESQLLQAHHRPKQLPTPVNLNGTARCGTMLAAGKAAIAAYKGAWGIYTMEDIKQYDMIVKKQ